MHLDTFADVIPVTVTAVGTIFGSHSLWEYFWTSASAQLPFPHSRARTSLLEQTAWDLVSQVAFPVQMDQLV